MVGKILVTGASGFIGRQALKSLETLGLEVYTVSSDSCDLLDKKQALALIKKIKPLHLLHTAWFTEYGKFWQAPENRDWLAASKNLFAAFAENGGKRIIGIGSCAEYDWNRKDKNPWKETDATNPHTPYGKAKLELYEWLKKSGLEFAWARAFLLFGRYENPARIVPYLITSALKNEPAKCSSGNQIRDFLDSETAGKILAKIAASNLTGAVNLASGQGFTLKEIAAKIYGILGKPNLAEFGSLPDRGDDPPYMVADIEKLRQIAPEIKKYDPGAALEKAVDWWRKSYAS